MAAKLAGPGGADRFNVEQNHDIGGHAIEAVVAVGETGFVYVASDPLLARQVAIKEYFPPTLAVRHEGAGHVMGLIAVDGERSRQRDIAEEDHAGLAQPGHQVQAELEVLAQYNDPRGVYARLPFELGIK